MGARCPQRGADLPRLRSEILDTSRPLTTHRGFRRIGNPWCDIYFDVFWILQLCLRNDLRVPAQAARCVASNLRFGGCPRLVLSLERVLYELQHSMVLCAVTELYDEIDE